MNIENPNVVEQLRPTSRNGENNTLTYQLTKQSVHPMRTVGRDARGFPIEETVPTVPWQPFLMLDGCINKVPMRTGSVPSMHADAKAYEQETLYDLIVAGCIPAWMCPYSTHFASWTHGPFVAAPNGETDCGGSTAAGGCDHLKAVGEIRREHVREIYRLDVEAFTKDQANARKKEFEDMRDGIVAGVGEAIAKHIVPTSQQALDARRNRTEKQLKGEE